jgi:hypothetical protein
LVGIHRLQELTDPILRGERRDLLYEEMRLGLRLHEAILAAGVPARELLEELHSWNKGLLPEELQG